MNKLYYSTGACSLAGHIVLEEIGAPYELEAVNLKAGEQKRPEFLAMSPKGSTPVLLTEHGPLTENVAILAYLAATHPEAGLAPTDDAWASAQLTSFNGFLGSSVHPNIGKLLFYPLGEAEKAAQRDVTLAKLRLVEDHLLVGPWALGEAYSTADPYLMVFERWARQGGLLDPAEFPRMNAHLDAVQARPAVQRVFDQEGIAKV
ncbi:glutathione S-transferase family protein [Brevundimonas aveniformis]|uniref:glutathione S-transferase family protein n=1 Tax=Brevundimonas aveniformis TaxID=370977 RepID=UPI002491D284|nr:glutathione S-transferase N-terminal domain-containing protein [Brevundimonas aveniformis]